jgi:high-affinity Fe2+/Pb2+ permease
MAAGRGLFFGVLAGLAVVGMILVWVGRRLARRDREIISSFLKTTLEAREE